MAEIPHPLGEIPLSMKMTVTYDDTQVSDGVELFPSTVTYEPHVEIIHRHRDLDTFFTLVMTDPDVPSPDDLNKREHLHWLVTDIPGTVKFANSGTCLMRYESPNPDIGIHSFVFILFKQKCRNCVTPPSSRDHFITKNFIEENDLDLPVAAVYFKSKREPAP